MGAVYLARQERPHRQVAVKVLRPHLLAADAQSLQVFLERFRREADATAALDHANIVPIYEFGEERGVAYLVMPYLADGSLAELLAREGQLSVATTVRYIEQAAAALDHAHAHGIVHRDVKPSNLLLHPDGRLLLTDFGIARAISRNAQFRPDDPWLNDAASQGDVTLTQLGSAMGTPEYMAPEQVQGDPVTAATDIYALGILTYVMLSGRSPFGGGDVTAILSRQLKEPPRPLRPLRPDVHAQVEEVIFWTLAKDPDERPASAGAYARSLREARRGHTLGRLWGWTASGESSRGSGLIAATNEQTPATVSVRLPERTRPLPSSAGLRALGRADAPTHRTLGDFSPLSSHSQTIVRGARSDGLDAPDAYAGPRTVADHFAPRRGEASGGLGGAPIWPGAGQQEAGERPHHGAWFLLIALASVLVIALGAATFLGALASHGAPNPTATVAHGVAHAPLPTATSTPLATATPTAPANWLTVSPETISLGCKGTKKSATVTIRNAGPRTVSWEAQIPKNLFGSDDVTVSPASGEIHAGGSATITVTNRTPSTEHSNYIALQLGNEDAGQPPVIAYTVAACFGG
jgi:serine/threonine protein kinase